MRRAPHRILARLAGAGAAAGLVLTGLVATAGPASAAACSGSTGVTVVVDTGSSISTRCASGDPSSAWRALESAGHSVTPVAQFPGAICRINGYPSSDPCQRMPPADAYWAFYHAPRGGSWTYSTSGARSYDPAPGTVVGFRFGSGQKPRVAPPEKTATSTPKPTTAAPKPTTAAPKPTTAAPKPTSAPRSGAQTTAKATTTTPSARPSVSASASRSAPAGPSPAVSASASASPSTSSTSGSPSATAGATTAAAGSPSSGAGSGPGLGTLLAGGGLVAAVAGGAGWAAWRRRGL